MQLIQLITRNVNNAAIYLHWLDYQKLPAVV